MDEADQTLVGKINEVISSGLTESGSVQFLALLSVSEYDRLIETFRSGETGMSEHTRRKLVIILEKLREAKRNRKT